MAKESGLLRPVEFAIGSPLKPANAGIAVATKGKSTVAVEAPPQLDPSVREELMKLVQRLFLTPGQTPPNAVMFAAIDAKTRCSRLCAITAELLAESIPGSVCLVESNFRSPSLPGIFGVENHHGLADSLRREGSIRGFANQVRHGNLWLLTSGLLDKDAVNLLNCDRMKERIAELRSEFDFLIFDVPPLNLYADAMVLGRMVDGALLVLEANETRRESALRVAEILRGAKIPVLGAVLNSRTFPIPGSLYKRL